jgi:hypothetical protein
MHFWSSVSVRTKVVAGAFPAVFIVYLVIGTVASQNAGGVWLLLSEVAAAVFILWAAFQLPERSRHRRIWILIGLVVSALSAGDILSSYQQMTFGHVAVPGLPDVFYVLNYLLLAPAVLLAVLGLGQFFDLRRSFASSALVGAGATLAAYVLFRPVLAGPNTQALQKAFDVLYPLADIWLLLVPSLALVLTLSRLAGGRTTWPWWFLAVGASMFAVIDTLLGLADLDRALTLAAVLQVASLMGLAVVVMGASVAVDVDVLSAPRKHADTRV